MKCAGAALVVHACLDCRETDNHEETADGHNQDTDENKQNADDKIVDYDEGLLKRVDRITEYLAGQMTNPPSNESEEHSAKIGTDQGSGNGDDPT